MLDFGFYLVYRAGSLVLGALPLRLLYSLGALLGLIAWALHAGYRRLAQRNLAIAFAGEKTPAELRRLTRRHFQRLGANLLSSLKLATMSLEKVAPRVVIENEELAHNELRGGRPLVVVLSHLGNWELFAQIFPRDFGYVRNGNIYQALRNRYIDAHIRQQRTRAGVELFDRREGFNRAIELLRSGGVQGVMSDQHAGDQGLWTPFFGRLASTTPLAALLAKRTGAAMITAAIYTDGPARWRMVFGNRIDRPDDSISSLTAKVNGAIAERISRAPEDWFWVHNRWKTPKPNFLLTEYKRGIYLPPDMPAAELKPFRILIRATNWLGDSVISAAAVRAIKRGRPDAHITIAAPAKIAPVWQLIAEVDEVLAIPERSLGATVRLIKKQQPFDVAVLFPNSLRVALEAWLARIPRRVGYRGHQRAWLLNQIVPGRVKRGPIDHQVNDYLHLAQHLGAAVDAVDSVPPARRFAANGNGVIKIGLCPGAEYGPAKRWLPERFSEVAAAVASGRPVQWILFGIAPDAATGKLIAEQLGEKCVNRIGQTTIEQLIDELRECRALLTNDTGTMHLATLLGVPVVAVFGSTEHRLTGPLGDGHIVIRHHVECSPCFLRECPIDFRCMKAVTSDEVTEAVLQQISAPLAATDQPRVQS